MDRPKSSKDAYYLERTRHGDSSLIREKVLPRPSLASRERAVRHTRELDDRPSKRRRLSNSPTVKSTSIIVDQLHSIESKNDEIPRPKEDLRNMYGYEPSKNTPPNTKSSIRHTALRDLNNPEMRRAALQSHNNRRSSSPDALFHTDDFTRNARQQRLFEQEDIASHSAEAQPSSSARLAHFHPPTQTEDTSNTHRLRHRSNSITKTPEQSKMSARLREQHSPDALQADFDSSKKQQRIRKTPLHAMNRPEIITCSFELRTFVAQAFGGLQECVVGVAENPQKFYIQRQSDAEPGRISTICELPLNLIRKIIMPKQGPDYQQTKILALYLSMNEILNESLCYLEFQSHEGLVDFHNLILKLDSTIATLDKDTTFLKQSLAKAWTKTEKLISSATDDLPVNSVSNHQSADTVHYQERSKRLRTIDRLDAPQPKATTIQSHDQHRHHKHQDLNGNTDLTALERKDTSIDQKSNLRKSRRVPDRKTTPPTDLFEISHRRQGPIWRDPLVFPLSGKRRETVSWEDLERLEDDHYLNDSLVSLFLRYLQEQADQKTFKRIHFFNTFFYDKLTTLSEGKGKNRINYEGVASWTKLFDLFSRDFVIVPVNEHFHWYAMIVCNLKWFKKQVEQKPLEEEDIEIVEDSNLVGVEDEEPDAVGDILQSDVLPPEAHIMDAELEGKQDTLPIGTKTNSGRRLPRKARLQRKWDVTKPIIITLDSLNMSRSGTAGTLKEYIVEEAKQKQNWDIRKEDISGMTAKNIPYQKNLSDCGLYMCMYIEQFMRDPDTFVHTILQRDTERIRWPQSIASGVLRQRMYDTMQNLHSVQMKEQKESGIPAVGSILIRDEDFHQGMKASVVSPLGTTTDILRGLDFYDDFSNGRTRGDTTNQPLFSEYATDFIDTEIQPEADVLLSTQRGRPFVEIWDDDLPEQKNRSQVKTQATQHIHRQPPTRITSKHFPEVVEDHDELDLQSELPVFSQHSKRGIRSPEMEARRSNHDAERRRNGSKSRMNSELDGVLVPDSPPRSRAVSRMSVDTEYLTSDRSYPDNRHEPGRQHNGSQEDVHAMFNGFSDDVQITGSRQARGYTLSNTSQHQSEIPESINGDERVGLVDMTATVDDDADMLMH